MIERLYGNATCSTTPGQWAHYGRVGRWIITSNEDGTKHRAMNILYSLQPLRCDPASGPPDLLGEAGPRA